MPLPAPHLDDWKFQELVNDAKRRIGLRCPEWTDHNVSDPGVTLIELFAWMTELTLYRMNQVPERAYVKFLEMLGITLEPPTSAQTELRFRLSRPIEDGDENDGDLRHGHVLPAHETRAATVRTDFEEAIEFTTDRDLRFTRPGLRYVLGLPPKTSGEAQTVGAVPDGAGVRRFLWDAKVEWKPEPAQNGGFTSSQDDPLDRIRRDDNSSSGFMPVTGEGARTGFPVFSAAPRQNDTLWVGFDEDVAQNTVELTWDCKEAAGVGLQEESPAAVWEVYEPNENRWERLEVLADETRGLNRPGSLEIALPAQLEAYEVAGVRARWIRCRYTTNPADHPATQTGAGDELRPVLAYEESPQIVSVAARTVGGTVSASHATVVRAEEIGQSDGAPGQTFYLRQKPILTRTDSETLRVGPQDAALGDMEDWTEVSDFAASGPRDRHYTLDPLSGEVRFGPLVTAPDGTVRAHGKTPERGDTLRFAAYRIGGGTIGNVRAREIQILKSGQEYIADVHNPRRAAGGREAETLDHAKMRAQMLLRMRNRAVTGEDFEFLALRASSSVGRARCVPPGEDGANPGEVRLLLVPRAPGVPTPSDLKLPPQTLTSVRAFLDERRLLTTVLKISEPEYVFVSTDLVVVAAPDMDTETLRRRLKENLEAYFHPVTGGLSGEGLPFGGTLTMADIYLQVQRTPGVAFLQSAPTAYLSTARDGVFSPERAVALEQGEHRLLPNQILATRAHRVRVVPMSLERGQR